MPPPLKRQAVRIDEVDATPPQLRRPRESPVVQSCSANPGIRSTLSCWR